MMASFYCQDQNACQNAFLFKFVFSLGNKETIGKISLTTEATNSILVLIVGLSLVLLVESFFVESLWNEFALFKFCLFYSFCSLKLSRTR